MGLRRQRAMLSGNDNVPTSLCLPEFAHEAYFTPYKFQGVRPTMERRSTNLSVVQKYKHMSGQKMPHRLRGERKAWGLNQCELAMLLDAGSGDHVSRVERALRRPSARLLVASHILFRRSVEHLFKSLYDAMEEHVVREAYILHEHLAHEDSPKAKRKCELLAQVIKAAADRHKPNSNL